MNNIDFKTFYNNRKMRSCECRSRDIISNLFLSVFHTETFRSWVMTLTTRTPVREREWSFSLFLSFSVNLSFSQSQLCYIRTGVLPVLIQKQNNILEFFWVCKPFLHTYQESLIAVNLFICLVIFILPENASRVLFLHSTRKWFVYRLEHFA